MNIDLMIKKYLFEEDDKNDAINKIRINLKNAKLQIVINKNKMSQADDPEQKRTLADSINKLQDSIEEMNLKLKELNQPKQKEEK